MRRAALAVLLVACGPSVSVGEDESGSSTTDGSTTSPVTVDPTNGTSATTASTTASTTVSTTMSSDEVTSIDPSSSDVDDGNDADAYIKEPDGGCFTVCIECDIWAQDCSEGEKCMGWANDGGDAWNAHRCTPVDPNPAGIGDPCFVEGSGVSGIDNCELGAMCWGVDPLTNEGTCAPMCTGSPNNPQCPVGLVCMDAFEDCVIVCLPPCDPLAPACAADEVCAHEASVDPIDHPFVCQPIPPFEPQPYGLPCGQLQLCDDGLACVDAVHVPGCEDLHCCTTLGDIAAPPVCPDVTQTCIPFDPKTMEGLCFCGSV